MTDLPLATEFPAATRHDWMKLVDGVLKGGDFEKKLVSRTYDGIAIAPIHEKAEPTAQPMRAEAGPWRVAQRVDHPDPAEANELAVQDLEGGADSLTLVFEGAASARAFGLRVENLDDLDRALSNIMLDLIHLRLDAGMRGRQAAAMFVALAEKRGHAPEDLQIDFGLDPIGAMASAGRLSAPWPIVAERCAETASSLLVGHVADKPSCKVFLADGRPFHEAGSSEAQELAAVLAVGLAYLRALEDGGIALDDARKLISFMLVGDADELLTIAKFRAFRRLWARIEAGAGLEPKPVRLHAETAFRMTTRRDPWVNILRTTVATFSAGLGGADSICALPFTAANGLPDAFARRVARNSQHILLQESNLWRVADPAAGAGGFEALTEALCMKAWAAFQELESEGGIVGALVDGSFQKRIALVQSARASNIAKRRDPITGVSEFPHLAEVPVSVLMDRPPPAEATPPAGEAAAYASPTSPRTFAEMVLAALRGIPISSLAPVQDKLAPASLTPLPLHRNAEPFERLRDQADAIAQQTGSRPLVFLANLGPVAEFNTRSGFARNAFEAGGIAAPGNDGFSDPAAMVEAFQIAGTRLACLCSSDAIYADQAIAAARALKEAGCSMLYLAGRPNDLEADLRQAGVEAFIYAGMDLVAMLEDALARI